MIKKSIVILFFIFPFHLVFGQTNPCEEFNNLNTKIRDGLISREDAQDLIRVLIPKIRDYFVLNGGKESLIDDWVFPLEGYNSSAIGGKNGSGYKPEGYDYFDGNKHGGHPAHDIFILDKDQDDLDDVTGKPVNVLSISNGIVIAYEPEWDENNSATGGLRGGKYVYIFDPSANSIFYYAHNKTVFVKPGDIVLAGQVIAECGRTGLNAYKKRSPTHLHLMYLLIEDGYPVPGNIYKDLLNTTKK